MPSHVKLFFWLGISAVLYSAVSIVGATIFPSPEMLAVMAKLPPAFSAEMQQGMLREVIVVTAIWTVIPSGLLWLAAFRRQNWARWSYALLFAFRKLMPFAIALAYPRFARRLPDIFHYEWLSPAALLPTAIVLAAIAFAFTGNARDWFRRTAVVTA